MTLRHKDEIDRHLWNHIRWLLTYSLALNTTRVFL
jgi:hypothetical protein